MRNSVEFKAFLKGRPVTVYSEVDGYKPLGVEVTDEDGNEVTPSEEDTHRLYEQACREVVEKRIARADAEE